MSELKAFDIVVAEEYYCEGIVKYRRAVYDKSEADEVIAEKDAEIRSTKRALWLARANNAINSYDKWNLFANFESEDKLFTIDEYDETPGVTDFITLRTYAEWCKVWQNVGRKCLKKAEEYR